MAGVSQPDPGGTPARGGEGGYRLLVVATTEAPGDALRREVEERVGDRDDPKVHVVAPALTEGPLEHVMGDVDQAAADADSRLDSLLSDLRSTGAEVTGVVGDADPVLAIEDALQTFPADEILVVTHRGDESRWLEGDVFDRAKEKFEPPMSHAVVDGAAGGDGLSDIESRGRGADAPGEEEADPDSRNLPPFSARDLAGLLVAIVGTIVLGILAATCDSGEGTAVEHGGGTSGECTAVLLIAVGVALINAAHIVGLFLFQSVRYRGGWARFFSVLSLTLTPLGIIAALILR